MHIWSLNMIGNSLREDNDHIIFAGTGQFKNDELQAADHKEVGKHRQVSRELRSDIQET